MYKTAVYRLLTVVLHMKNSKYRKNVILPSKHRLSVLRRNITFIRCLLFLIIIITRSIIVSEMTKALQKIQGKNDCRDGSSNVTWRSAAECSTVGQQRLEKLDRRWLKDGCVGQQAMMTMQSGDADEPRQQMTDGVPQQGTAGLSGVGICTPELHPLGDMGWNASHRCITIVQPLQNEGRNQWLENGARKWATNTPKLTQNRKTGSYCLWNVRPHWHISVHVDAEVADIENWHDLVSTHSDGWHW